MTGIQELDNAIGATQDWITELTRLLGWQDRSKAYLALRAGLHALRDCLPLEEAAYLGTELPALLRGIYYEAWHPAGRAFRLRTREAFLERILEGVHRDPAIDPELVARALLALLAGRLPAGEFEAAKAVTPGPLRELWPA
jgi:uncharacterized protein (DUF2267 family)